MTITRTPSIRPGNGNPGIVPPWLITPIQERTHAARAQATSWDPTPVSNLDVMPRYIEQPIHTWSTDPGYPGHPGDPGNPGDPEY